MAGNEWQLRLGQLAVDDMQVGAADRARVHANENLALGGLGNGKLNGAQRLARSLQHHRAHRSSLRPLMLLTGAVRALTAPHLEPAHGTLPGLVAPLHPSAA